LFVVFSRPCAIILSGGLLGDFEIAWLSLTRIFIFLSFSKLIVAGSCFKKSSAVDAVAAYQSAVSLLTDNGRLTQAAKLCRECAELYESEEIAVDGKSA